MKAQQAQSIRVLIAEDDAWVADITKEILACIGYEVVGEAGNGAQAVEMTKELEPDVVLMDIQMPAMDGLEAAREIQKVRPTPVVILTSHDDWELVEEATAVGVGAYLMKPPIVKEVERAVALSLARFEDLNRLGRLNEELEAALEKVNLLSGLLPICSGCGRIGNEEGAWEEIDLFAKKRQPAESEDCVCPDCRKPSETAQPEETKESK